MDWFKACLELEQLDGSVRPIACISQAFLPTILDVEAGGSVWAIKWLRRYVRSTKFFVYSDCKALENTIPKFSAGWCTCITSPTRSSIGKVLSMGSANGNANYVSRLPLPKIAPNRVGDVDAAEVLV